MNRASYRGQPLVALMLILGGWVAARAMVWDAAALGMPESARPTFALATPDGPASPAAALSTTAEVYPDVLPRRDFVPPPEPLAMPGAQPITIRPATAPAASSPRRLRLSPSLYVARPQVKAEGPARLTVSDRLLWMAALARLPLPVRGLTLFSASAKPADAPSASAYRDPRWSADAWLLLRQGGSVLTAAGFVPATYGASQAGAIVRYRLAPDSAHRPSLYLRGSAALNGSREREAALGLSARPFAHVPLVAAAEARVNHQPSGTRLRPAAFVYTELPPFAVPLGARGEFYGQAGYVGGNFASAFADGQLRVDRRFVSLGNGELRAGGGVWGGAQKGASRLDIGPTATFGMPLAGTAGARLGVDWRFRVAGNAAPASGPALTLSAGF